MKKLFVSLSIFAASLFLFAAPLASAHDAFLVAGQAASSEEACEALRAFNPDNAGCGASNGGVNNIIRVVLNLLSVIAGIIGVVMVIISGFKYITAQGDATEIGNAKKTLIYAIVGLLVVAFAQFIVRFVLARATN